VILSHLKLKTFFCLVSNAFFILTLVMFSALQAEAKPPYQVVAYCNQDTEAPSNSVTDSGQGTAIDWATDVPWSDLTVVADAFFVPKTDDTFKNEAQGSALVTAAHNQNVRCIVSLGGSG